MCRRISGYGINPSHMPNISFNPISRGGEQKSHFKAKSLFKLNTFDLSLVVSMNTTVVLIENSMKQHKSENRTNRV